MTILDSAAHPVDPGSSATGGLDGVVVADTRLSRVDGAAGELILRGLTLADAVRRHGFEGMLGRLWADLADTSDLAGRLGRARGAAFALVPDLLPAARRLPPAPALRAMVAAMPESDDPASVVAAMPVFLAASLRARAGLELVPPDQGLSQAADLLRMIGGAPADARRVAALDTYLVTVSDHGLNASTFAARVVASTGAGMVPAVVAGLCALEGPLHGGAPGPVLDMLEAIGSPGRAEGWIAAELAAGRRLMGFGHRIYRRRDPRADVLKAAVATLDSPRIRLAEAVEQAALAALRVAKPDRVLETNVEFWTALLLDAAALPRDAFTAVFAMGRVAGWTAHVLEQRRTGRLIRPDSRYVGPPPGEGTPSALARGR